jgi:hypothetical protein
MQIHRHIRTHCDLTRRQERALLAALFLVGLLAAYAWVLGPHAALLQASQRYERAMYLHLNASEAANEELALRSEKLQALRAERTAFADLAFSPAGAKEFHYQLQAWCHETGLDVMSLGYANDERLAVDGARQATSAMVLRSATMTLHGSYGGVVTLLKTLESLPQRTWIDGFQMATVPAKPDWVACDMTVTICVDYDKELE